MPHKYITSLRVVDKDGNDKEDEFAVPVVIGHNIVLGSGANLKVAVNQDKEVELSAGYGLGYNDPATVAKFRRIIDGDPPNFSGTADGMYWVSAINLVKPPDGSFFLGVDRCYHTGLFPDSIHPESVDNQLSIIDTCPACTDCPDYDQLQTYIDVVKVAVDGQKDVLQDPAGTVDTYMKTITHWNYVVFLKSWRYNAEAAGNEIHASCKYTNHTSSDIPAGLTMEMDFNDAPADVKAFVIDTAVLSPTGNLTRDDLLLASGGGRYIEDNSSMSSESDVGDNVVRLTTKKVMKPGDGIRFYGGALSPGYVGSTRRVKVNFKLTMSGGTGNYETSFNTNKMVVIPGW